MDDFLGVVAAWLMKSGAAKVTCVVRGKIGRQALLD